MTNRINLLWFDDDLRPLTDGMTDERRRLQTWLRYMHTTDRVERICLIEVRDMATFRHELESRAGKPPGDPGHLDALLIDVLWREPGDPDRWNFGEFDPAFGDERVLALDAGAQLVGLMRNRRYARQRPAWLRAYDEHPIAILTTLIDHKGTVDLHVDEDVLRQLKILVKNSSSSANEPDEEFRRWLNGLVKRSARAADGPPGVRP